MRREQVSWGQWEDRMRIRFSMLSALVAIALLWPGLYWLYREALSQEQQRMRDMLEHYAIHLETATQAMGVDLVNVDSATDRKVRPLFRDPLMGQTMYPFVVQPSGEVRFHFFRRNARLSQEALVEMGRSPQRCGTMAYNFGDALEGNLEISYYYSQSLRVYVAVEHDRNIDSTLRGALRRVMVLVLILSFLAVWLLVYLVVQRPVQNVVALRSRLEALARGEHPATLEKRKGADILVVSEEVNKLIEGLGKTAAFALEIGQQNFSAEYEPLGPNDVLGNALLEMRGRIKIGMEQAAKQKEEESLRNWMNSSIAEFGRILREHGNDIQGLTDNVLQQLVTHLGAVEGGFYITEMEGQDTYLRLQSSVAYGRKKYLEDRVAFGEGLVGTCALEREMTYLTEIPADYCTITSGIGEAPPRALLLMPLKSGEELYGVIEMATLTAFSPHEIQFVQQLSESIASTLMSAQSNERTAILLQESQAQRQKMHEQEEAMRQNLEEVRATQEAMVQRREQLLHLERALSASFLYGEVSEVLVLRSCNQRMAQLGEEWGLPFWKGSNLLEVLREGDPAASVEGVAEQAEKGQVYTVVVRIAQEGTWLMLQLSLSSKELDSGEHGYYVLGAAFTQRCEKVREGEDEGEHTL